MAPLARLRAGRRATDVGCDREQRTRRPAHAVAEHLDHAFGHVTLAHNAHDHRHWGRPREGEKMGQADRMPEFLREANSPEHWARYKKLFAERKAAGFPGSEPL